MYFVDRKNIERLLAYIDRLLIIFDKEQPFQTDVKQLALERIAHTLIESILDVGNMMIDGFIMRDPGGYHDIIHIMLDEGVLPEQDQTAYLAVVDLRQGLIQEYADVDHEQILSILRQHRRLLGQFSTHIETYLDNELGTANAFIKE